MATYSPIYSGPPRHYGSTRTTKKYIAIHNTANDATAEQEASYAKRREDSVSSHYYVDPDSILQSLDTAYRAYHAGSTIGNSQAIAYEITGTNGKSRSWWLANVAWPLLARQIAADCRAHNIEPRLLSVAEIKAGSKTGIITHDQMRQAWGGTTHTDPGPNFPLDYLLALVKAELEGDDMFTEDDRRELHNSYVGWYFGGPSMGLPVEDDDCLMNAFDPKNPMHAVARQYRNNGPSQLAQIRKNQAKILAALSGEGGVTPEQLAALGKDVADRLGALRFVPDTDS